MIQSQNVKDSNQDTNSRNKCFRREHKNENKVIYSENKVPHSENKMLHGETIVLNGENKVLNGENKRESYENEPFCGEDKGENVTPHPFHRQGKDDDGAVCSDDEYDLYYDSVLPKASSPRQTRAWLRANGFQSHAHTFKDFTGGDMLALTRFDFVDICEAADGEAIFNALNPSRSGQLRVYVQLPGEKHYHALFLRTRNSDHLARKVCRLLGVPARQDTRLYLQRPSHQPAPVTAQVVESLEDETLLSVQVKLDVNQKSSVFLVEGEAAAHQAPPSPLTVSAASDL
ncbi:transcription factor CP2-like [Homarus americanus]|uniref:Upstream-binding protein 1-like n=1 Tax=Homarus americanus TaxID=6706 RepID=A0A8J5JNP9_HOMAM|nr:transcription factor CP2-like [Homarus americanus]KAG7159551.1 Upstream-binding protein 1-like [Homarus americanus]